MAELVAMSSLDLSVTAKYLRRAPKSPFLSTLARFIEAAQQVGFGCNTLRPSDLIVYVSGPTIENPPSA
jgi:hypothetical protein